LVRLHQVFFYIFLTFVKFGILNLKKKIKKNERENGYD